MGEFYKTKTHTGATKKPEKCYVECESCVGIKKVSVYRRLLVKRFYKNVKLEKGSGGAC